MNQVTILQFLFFVLFYFECLDSLFVLGSMFEFENFYMKLLSKTIETDILLCAILFFGSFFASFLKFWESNL